MRIYGFTLGCCYYLCQGDYVFLSMLLCGDFGPFSVRYKLLRVARMNVMFAKIEQVLKKNVYGLDLRIMTLEYN